MGYLSETTTLIGIQEDVVNEERGGSQRANSHGGLAWHNGGGGHVSDGEVAVSGITELKVDLDFVVLEGNEGQGKSWVPVEPELKGNVQNLRWHGGRASHQVGELWHVTDHVGITKLMTSGLGQLVPDVQPRKNTRAFALFIGYSPGTRLYLKLGNQGSP